MKKIMIALAVAAFAAMSQAAAFTWATSANIVGLDIGSVAGNGVFAADGSNMKNASTLNYVLTIFEAGTANVVGTANGAMKWSATGSKANVSATVAEALQGTTYDYQVVLTGTQNSLTGEINGWDYTDATITATISGSVTTLASGTTKFTSDAPATWTVAGAVETIPEPTSAMLLLLGMAGLALKRKQA